MVASSSSPTLSRLLMVLPDVDSLGHQRLLELAELGLVVPPLRDRGVVQRATHLGGAGGRGRSRIAVKRQAAILPLESAMLQQPARLALLIGHEILVADLMDRSGQRPAPMSHQANIGRVVFCDLAQIVGKRIAALE